MALKKFTGITEKQLSQKGVTALADRPSAAAQYGVGGLSAEQLKRWFDKLARLIAEQLNLVTETLASDEGASYIRVALDGLGIDTLQALADAIRSGTLATGLMVTYGLTPGELVSVQVALNDLLARLGQCESDVTDLDLALDALTATVEANTEHIVAVQEKAEENAKKIASYAASLSSAISNANKAADNANDAVADMQAAVDRLEYPIVTTADNGKFLRVVDGVWRAVRVESAEGSSF